MHMCVTLWINSMCVNVKIFWSVLGQSKLLSPTRLSSSGKATMLLITDPSLYPSISFCSNLYLLLLMIKLKAEIVTQFVTLNRFWRGQFTFSLTRIGKTVLPSILKRCTVNLLSELCLFHHIYKCFLL